MQLVGSSWYNFDTPKPKLPDLSLSFKLIKLKTNTPSKKMKSIVNYHFCPHDLFNNYKFCPYVLEIVIFIPIVCIYCYFGSYELRA